MKKIKLEKLVVNKINRIGSINHIYINGNKNYEVVCPYCKFPNKIFLDKTTNNKPLKDMDIICSNCNKKFTIRGHHSKQT